MRRHAGAFLFLALVAFLGVIVVVLAGSGEDDPAGGAEVVVIGDSVTEQSAEHIEAELGDDVTVVGRSGYRTDQLLGDATEQLGGDDPPGVAVVMAGYNDLWQGREDQDRAAELIALMAGADCAVWVLVPTVGPWERDRARAFEARVVAAAEDAGVAVETAWRDAVDSGAGDEPLVVGDEVHPSEAGKQRVADVMAGAVERECG